MRNTKKIDFLSWISFLIYSESRVYSPCCWKIDKEDKSQDRHEGKGRWRSFVSFWTWLSHRLVTMKTAMLETNSNFNSDLASQLVRIFQFLSRLFFQRKFVVHRLVGLTYLIQYIVTFVWYFRKWATTKEIFENSEYDFLLVTKRLKVHF